MKKMIIAVFAIAFAVAAEAATANWSVGAANIFNGTDSTATTAKYSGVVMLFDAGLMSQSDLYDLVASKATITDQTTGFVKNLTANNGNVANTTVAYGNQSTDEQLNTYKFYLAIVTDDQVYFSQELTKTAGKTATAAATAFANQNNGSTTFSSVAPTGEGFQGAGHWSAVPEPTSGLLMLLGMAGLALRRRRA